MLMHPHKSLNSTKLIFDKVHLWAGSSPTILAIMPFPLTPYYANIINLSL